MTKILFASIALLAFCACSNDGTHQNSSGGLTMTNAVISDGVYVSECQDLTSEMPIFERETLTLTGGKFNDLHQIYTDRNCTQMTAVQTMTGAFGVDASVQHLIFNVAEATMFPLDETLVRVLNEQKSCGLSDWKVNVSNNLLVGTCEKDMRRAEFIVKTSDDQSSIEMTECGAADGGHCNGASLKLKRL